MILCAPFGKVCPIVQGKASVYGTEFMAKSLTFVWALLGTKPYYHVDVDSRGKILEELATLVDQGIIPCTLTQTFSLTLEGLRKAHQAIEQGGSVGKNGLEIPDNEGAFT